MKNPRDFFKNNPSLLEEPEVTALLEYCESLEDEIVEFRFEKNENKQLILLDMIKEVLKGCNALEKEQMEHERFGYEAPNYQETITNLKRYILEICRDNQIYL